MTDLSERSNKGWCPGALRPMESGDGLLVRIKPQACILDSRAARAIADLAARYGNGLLDLTARANLQIRGVQPQTLAPLQRALDQLGMLDDSVETEAARTVMASPLAGIDPSARQDIRPMLATLEDRLKHARLPLPAKFAFLIDDGGALPLVPTIADIAFVAEGRDNLTLFLGGYRAGSVASASLADAALDMAKAFLALRAADERRMSSLVGRLGIAALVESYGISATLPPERPRPAARALGYRVLGSLACIGAGLPFGRLAAADLAILSDLAEEAGGELRLTPWRCILIAGPGVTPDLLAGRGFVTNEDHPIRAVAACPGHPACASGAGDVRADAEELAPMARRLGDGITLHLSACSKGCALAAPAPVTLVATGAGYDVIFDGRAGDPPTLRNVGRTALQALLETRAIQS